MNTKNKNLIRAAVLAALFAWPGVETYRYFAATQSMLDSEQRLASVNRQLAQLRIHQGSPAVVKASLKVKE